MGAVNNSRGFKIWEWGGRRARSEYREEVGPPHIGNSPIILPGKVGGCLSGRPDARCPVAVENPLSGR